MRLLAVSMFVAAVTPELSARAFCQTTTCDPNRSTCERDAHGCVVEGEPLHWSKDDLAVELDARSATAAGFDAEAVTSSLRTALETWERAACSADRTLVLHLSLAVDCAPVPGDITVRFQASPGLDEEPAVLAASDVDFEGDGALRHVAIRVLAGPRWLTTGDERVEFDLLSTLTHELGHAIGLSHSTVADAVMLDDARRGQLTARTLSEDDRAAICTLYAPVDAEPSASRPEPGDAWDAGCVSAAETPEGAGCAVASRAHRHSGRGLVWLSAAALVWPLRGAARSVYRRRN
jgi:hypothetical protein